MLRQPYNSRIIDGNRYFPSPCIKTLGAIRAKIRPEPVREPLPPAPKQYAAACDSETETARRPLAPPSLESIFLYWRGTGSRSKFYETGTLYSGSSTDPLSQCPLLLLNASAHPMTSTSNAIATAIGSYATVTALSAAPS